MVFHGFLVGKFLLEIAGNLFPQAIDQMIPGNNMQPGREVIYFRQECALFPYLNKDVLYGILYFQRRFKVG